MVSQLTSHTTVCLTICWDYYQSNIKAVLLAMCKGNPLMIGGSRHKGVSNLKSVCMSWCHYVLRNDHLIKRIDCNLSSLPYNRLRQYLGWCIASGTILYMVCWWGESGVGIRCTEVISYPIVFSICIIGKQSSVLCEFIVWYMSCIHHCYAISNIVLW